MVFLNLPLTDSTSDIHIILLIMYKENNAEALYEEYKRILQKFFSVAQEYRMMKSKNEEEVKYIYEKMSIMRDHMIKMSKKIRALDPSNIYVFADVGNMMVKGANPNSVLIWVDPMEFLRLAGSVGSIKHKLKERNTNSANTINKYYYNILYGTVQPTELELSPDNKIIVRHDGRHRAYAAAMIPKKLKLPLQLYWKNKPDNIDLSQIMRQDDPERPNKKGLKVSGDVKEQLVHDNIKTLKIALDKSTVSN